MIRGWGEDGRRERPKWKVALGGHRGSPRLVPFEPPPCLPPVPPEAVKREALLPKDNVMRAVGILVEEYERCSFGSSWLANMNARGSGRQLPAKSMTTIFNSAILLLRAGVSLEGYVQYVFRELQKYRGRRPYLMQVLGPKAVQGWLRSYNRGGNKFKVLKVATYRASPERRRLYQEMVLSARERALSVEH